VADPATRRASGRVGIGTRGEIIFEHTYTDGLHAQVSSNQDDIVLRAKVTESVGVICTHNHPHSTDPGMTEDDSRSTSELARRLQSLGIVLLASSVVSPPAQPPIQENRGRGYIPEIDAYQARCQEYDQLRALYGGKRPAWVGGGSMLESLKSSVLKRPAPAKTDNEALLERVESGAKDRQRRFDAEAQA
jgi:hypothetical protein